MTRSRAWSAQALLVAVPVRLYRFVPHFGPPRCRFFPSCSEYALAALQTHGALRGSWLTMRRLARCHPFNPGGIDRVPSRPGASTPQGVTS